MGEMLSKFVGIVKSHKMIGANAKVHASHDVMAPIHPWRIVILGRNTESDAGLTPLASVR